MWLWVVLEASHSQDNCGLPFPKGAALLWGSQGGPWFLSPAQQAYQAREPSQG